MRPNYQITTTTTITTTTNKIWRLQTSMITLQMHLSLKKIDSNIITIIIIIIIVVVVVVSSSCCML